MMNDLIDNKLLKENFRNKNYIYCINTLQNEIKQKLIARVRIFKPEYKYCNLADLKTNCYRYLNLGYLLDTSLRAFLLVE